MVNLQFFSQKLLHGCKVKVSNTHYEQASVIGIPLCKMENCRTVRMSVGLDIFGSFVPLESKVVGPWLSDELEGGDQKWRSVRD